MATCGCGEAWYDSAMMDAELEAQLEAIRHQVQRIAKEFNLGYQEESYNLLFISKRECCLRNYLTAPMYAEFGATPQERAWNVEKFLNSSLYAQITGPGSVEGCVMARKELEEERAVIVQVRDPSLRAEYEALYDKLAHHMAGGRLTLLARPENEEERRRLEHLVLHEWLHVLLMDNGIVFQDRAKSWEWDEGLVTYLMAFLGREDLDVPAQEGSEGALADLHQRYRKAGRRWREILKGKRTPEGRKAAILEQLEA